jgi:hypothetical protein
LTQKINKINTNKNTKHAQNEIKFRQNNNKNQQSISNFHTFISVHCQKEKNIQMKPNYFQILNLMFLVAEQIIK